MKNAFVTAALVLSLVGIGTANDKTHVLVIVGPSNHPPGSHEVAAGARVMKHCLDNLKNVTDVTSEIAYRWPEPEQLAAASTLVFIGDTFPPNRLNDTDAKLVQIGQRMDAGCGIVCVHYATGLRGEDVAPDGDHPLLRWLGGYFANRTCPHHESFARIYTEATIHPEDESHPTLRGWREFTLHDEPYTNNYFGKDQNRMADNVVPLATSMLPPDNPRREVVAWGTERKDGGRGFGIVMPHFYKNWANDDLRRFILNGIVWSAGRDIPDDGVQSSLADLKRFSPESVEFVPRKKKSTK